MNQSTADISISNFNSILTLIKTAKDSQILSALLRELSWTNNLLVMSRTKTDEERLFYINLSIEVI